MKKKLLFSFNAHPITHSKAYEHFTKPKILPQPHKQKPGSYQFVEVPKPTQNTAENIQQLPSLCSTCYPTSTTDSPHDSDAIVFRD
jgi:hypothetical protein